MCSFYATSFPCECSSWRSSGYAFCEQRGTEKCKVSLKLYKWKTLCHTSRRAMRGRKYTPYTRLPPCCGTLDAEERKKLCYKCDSSPTDASRGPTLWHCHGHLELVFEDGDVSLEQAQSEFEKAVALWPVDHKKRYERRKGDNAAKGVWWSC